MMGSVPYYTLGGYMCDEMLKNRTCFVPEYASDVVSEFENRYIMRSIKTSSIDEPHEDFFYSGYVGSGSVGSGPTASP
jgi:hypothetical protein